MKIKTFTLLQTRFPKDTSAEFLIHERGTTTFAQLDNDSARFSAVLQSYGLVKSDRVAVQEENSPENAIVYFGYAGAVYVSLNTEYTVAKLNIS